MPTDTKLQNLIINDLTEEQYNALTPNENELYLTPDTSSGKKYYNHFITLSETGISCSFTITNSRPDPYTKIGDIYTYLNSSISSISISVTGSYNGASGKGILHELQITSPNGQSIVSFTKLEIEVVENVPTIKMTESAAGAYFSSVYSDKVVEL